MVGRAVVVALAGALVLAFEVRAEPVACQRSILKGSTKLALARAKALGKCEDKRRTGALSPATDCTIEPTTATKIARAESRLGRGLAKACGGPDRTCGTADDEPLAAIGWPAACPDFLGLGCTGPIAGCDDVAACLACVDREAVAQAIALAYDELTAPGAPDLARCQRTIGKETARFLDTRTKALRRCWEGRLKGAHANTCPSPGDGKAEGKIAKAAARARAKICLACGGADRDCGGGDDFSVAAVGFPPVCPAGDGCAAAVTDLGALVDCVTCVAGFDADCPTLLATPALAAYPDACRAADACPSRLQLDGDGDTLDLDLGWTSAAHDLTGPWFGRVTLAVFPCAGNGDPACGTCALFGPIENGGGPAFANRRCADATWVPCASDADCAVAGAGGPCRFFLGPPQPTGIGGFASCTLSEIDGPITGTVDVESGAVALVVPATMHSLNPQWPFPGFVNPMVGDPCPRCVGGTCDAGPRAGMPCTIQGHSTLFDDDTSLDCPPPDTDPFLASVPLVLPLGTTAQALTLGPASPRCSASGFATEACFCDTCNTAAAEPCVSDADCPGMAAGSCGGLRCLGGVNDGVACTTAGLADAACSGHCTGFTTPDACCLGAGFGCACGTRGEPTKPNACTSAVCSPTAAGDGECATGPFPGRCAPAEPYRACGAPSDCPVPGDTCAFAPIECPLPTLAATGAPDAPAAGAFQPALGGLACVRPIGSSVVNASRGLPGPVRAVLEVDALLE